MAVITPVFIEISVSDDLMFSMRFTNQNDAENLINLILKFLTQNTENVV